MSVILESLLQILFGAFILKVIYNFAVPRRLRVAFNTSGTFFLDTLFNLFKTLILIFNKFIETIKSFNNNEAIEAVTEVAATAVETELEGVVCNLEDVKTEESFIGLNELSMEDTYNCIVESFGCVDDSCKVRSKKKKKKGKK